MAETTDQGRDFVKMVFGHYDENDDGLIDADEVQKVLKQMDPDVPESGGEVWIKFLDDNEDGKVDLKEFALSMMEEEVSPQRELRATFRVFDSDKDGKITKEEMIEGTKLTNGGKEPSEDEIADFLSADKDGDEAVNRREARRALRAERLGQEVKELLAALDDDGDGKITQEEFDGTEVARKKFMEDDTDGDGAVSLKELIAGMSKKRGDADIPGEVKEIEADLLVELDVLLMEGAGKDAEETTESGGERRRLLPRLHLYADMQAFMQKSRMSTHPLPKNNALLGGSSWTTPTLAAVAVLSAAVLGAAGCRRRRRPTTGNDFLVAEE